MLSLQPTLTVNAKPRTTQDAARLNRFTIFLNKGSILFLSAIYEPRILCGIFSRLCSHSPAGSSCYGRYIRKRRLSRGLLLLLRPRTRNRFDREPSRTLTPTLLFSFQPPWSDWLEGLSQATRRISSNLRSETLCLQLLNDTLTSQGLLSNFGQFCKEISSGSHSRDEGLQPARVLNAPCVSLTRLQFPLHGVRRVLSLFARPLNVLAEPVNRVASHVRA